MLNVASVHGRFQPPHLDHLEYMLAALKHTHHLIIGITQPDFTRLIDCPEDPHRAEVKSNPLSYAERCAAIKAMLIASDVEESRFSFVRFPIEVPEKLVEAVGLEVTCFTTIRDQWNVVKVQRLKMLGYDVEVLWDRAGQPGRNGTEIRRKMALGDVSWKEDVHPAVVAYLLSIGIAARLASAE